MKLKAAGGVREAEVRENFTLLFCAAAWQAQPQTPIICNWKLRTIETNKKDEKKI
jgi:hypothetical protein